MEDLPAWLGPLRLTLPCAPFQAACSAAAGGAAVGVSRRPASFASLCALQGGFFFLWLSTDTEHTDASPMQKEGLDSLWKVVVFFVKEVAELPEGTGDAGNTECILLDRVGLSFLGGRALSGDHLFWVDTRQ